RRRGCAAERVQGASPGDGRVVRRERRVRRGARRSHPVDQRLTEGASVPVAVSYPGLYIEELPSSAHTIVPAPTSITVFVGYGHPLQGQVAENKDWGKAFQIFDFTEYQRMFGGFFQSAILDSNLPNAVFQFFLNGGSNAYVVALQPKLYTYPAGGGAPTSTTVGRGASQSVSRPTFVGQHVTDVAKAL